MIMVEDIWDIFVLSTQFCCALKNKIYDRVREKQKEKEGEREKRRQREGKGVKLHGKSLT